MKTVMLLFKDKCEITINQPFCKKTLGEIVGKLKLDDKLLVLGDYDGRSEGEIYPDIIIGFNDYHRELTNNPPDLSKGLGWEVKNNLNDGTNLKGGKGQLVKYARIYCTLQRMHLYHVFSMDV